MIRVLVTDDEPLVRFGLRMLLDAQDDIVVIGEACDGTTALTLTRELAPDLVLTDLRMPGMDGIAATKRLLALPNPPAVLVLTTFDTEEGVVEAMQAGAAGYLLKDAPPEQVVGAVRLVASGGTVLSSASAAHLLEASRPRDTAESRVPIEQRRRVEALDAQQREILCRLGNGMSNAEIARRMYLTEGTVKAYVSRLLAALKVDNRTQAAILAHRAGLLEEE
ncbi:response regulator transcription factor [Streptomyces sp. CBMA152]|uniref:response regulator n=1 Tax=Streptomyces sp. CBMA152 TaxID=1896312 RepID=UPI001660EB1C|nr:response regulator transcription factor [Streptomyces sp. CBMA152]MBD0746149.1 DNA-binding response regulator [Streptomyces sp. CBMA152]